MEPLPSMVHQGPYQLPALTLLHQHQATGLLDGQAHLLSKLTARGLAAPMHSVRGRQREKRKVGGAYRGAKKSGGVKSSPSPRERSLV